MISLWVGCTKGEQRYLPDSDILKLSKHVQVNKTHINVQDFRVKVTFLWLSVEVENGH